MSLPVCKFYLSNQKCRFGEHCRYSHSVNPKPPPLSRSKQSDDHGKAVNSRSVSVAPTSTVDFPSDFESHNHEDLINQFASSSLNPSATSFHPNSGESRDEAVNKESRKQAEPQKKICQYFAQHGTCAFGRSCWFSHVTDDAPPKSRQPEKSKWADNASHLRSRDVPPRFQRQNRQAELRSDVPGHEDITVEPEPEDLIFQKDVRQPKTKSRESPRQCQLFKSGKCRWGRRCRFSHSRNNDGGSQSRPFSQRRDDNLVRKGNDDLPSKKNEPPFVKSAGGNQSARSSQPLVLKQVLTLEELEEEGIETFRQLDINYLKRRFPKSDGFVLEDDKNFIWEAQFSPSDPDWSFDMKVFNLEFILPETYPKEAMTVKVLGGDDFPETVRRYLEVSISDWLLDRREGFADRGKVELATRPFLRWLDRNIEDLTTKALQQLKRELVARAAGLEFIPAEKLRARYTSESGSAGTEEDDDDDSTNDETDSEDQDDSEDESYSSEEEEGIERGGPSLSLDPEKKGTEIALRHLQLKEKATSLFFERLKLILQCARCKGHEEVIVTQGKVLAVTCGKCNYEMLTTYRPSLAHQFSSVIGYLDLDNCTAFDLIFQDCRAKVSCLNCSKQTCIDGLAAGQLIDGWCQACNARFKIATEAVKFTQLVYSGVDVSGNTEVEIIEKKARKPPKDPNIKEGCPLPDFGACKHYKHSYRWLRFPCCGKAYPCDVCHDKAENHEMVFANRMICGHCCKEQTFAATRPCNACGSSLTKIHTAHWEGGSGCRNKITMSKNDNQKYKSMNKTTSNHKKKVQSAGSKKKTTKLRHA